MQRRQQRQRALLVKNPDSGSRRQCCRCRQRSAPAGRRCLRNSAITADQGSALADCGANCALSAANSSLAGMRSVRCSGSRTRTTPLPSGKAANCVRSSVWAESSSRRSARVDRLTGRRRLCDPRQHQGAQAERRNPCMRCIHGGRDSRRTRRAGRYTKKAKKPRQLDILRLSRAALGCVFIGTTTTFE